MLYIVSTPIGNLEDITLRAIRTLSEVDLIVAEDTRHSGILLKKHGIEKTMTSFHSHSPDSQKERLLQELVGGKNLALISDAGTPGISDPGYVLIKEAIARGIQVTVIPGPSAVTAAVVASGLPANRFVYLGFLPIKKGRKTLMATLRDIHYTVVFYESPHRIMRTLTELLASLGERKIAVCREMTKMFEEIFRGNLSEAIAHFGSKQARGEFTIVLGSPGKTANDSEDSDIIDATHEI